MTALTTKQVIGVVGAGTMGAGIAQLAAAAGHPVVLFDSFDGAAAKGKARIADGLAKMVARGKMAEDDRLALVDRITLGVEVASLAPCALVIEAIVENLEVKRDLFATLEKTLAETAILATNTSSISITSIGRDLKRPEQLVGMHFFNPAPVMKLVEVVSGVATARSVAETVFDTAQAWGKIAVHTKSTPGFIVNRVARPYYAEALRLFEEQVAEPATIDALLTEGAGFRMGPFALMDLIGNDVNYTVCKSVFDAYYQEPRFRPSILQLEQVNAGRLGQKSGRGWYDYAAGAEKPAPLTVAATDAPLIDDLDLTGAEVEGVAIRQTDGRTAAQWAKTLGQPVIVLDYMAAEGKRLGFAASADVPATVIARLVATLSARGIAATHLPDWPGLVALRTIAMLANEGYEAVLQGVTDATGVDNAMRFGVNYPKGPMAWARDIGLARILATLDSIHALTGDPRYRAAMTLRMAAA